MCVNLGLSSCETMGSQPEPQKNFQLHTSQVLPTSASCFSSNLLHKSIKLAHGERSHRSLLSDLLGDWDRPGNGQPATLTGVYKGWPFM